MQNLPTAMLLWRAMLAILWLSQRHWQARLLMYRNSLRQSAPKVKAGLNSMLDCLWSSRQIPANVHLLHSQLWLPDDCFCKKVVLPLSGLSGQEAFYWSYSSWLLIHSEEFSGMLISASTLTGDGVMLEVAMSWFCQHFLGRCQLGWGSLMYY